MDAKGRTFRFAPLKDPRRWRVDVYVQGKAGVQRRHYIKVIGDAYGKYKAYCNCEKAYYGRKGCHHEEAFGEYCLEKLAKGEAKAVKRVDNTSKTKGKGEKSFKEVGQ